MAATTPHGGTESLPSSQHVADVALGSTSERIPSGHVAIPQTLRLSGVESVRAAPNWEQALSLYSEDERGYLQARNSAYFDVLRFASAEQQREMIEQGFPMPEEWLAARNIPTEQLKQMAEAGNAKGQIFYIDRSISELSVVLSKRGLNTKDPQDMRLLRLYAAISTLTHDRLTHSRSPFAAYQSGLFETRTNQGQPLEPFAASIQLAGDLGHARAEEISAYFYQQHPGLNPGSVMSFYRSMRKATLHP